MCIKNMGIYEKMKPQLCFFLKTPNKYHQIYITIKHKKRTSLVCLGLTDAHCTAQDIEFLSVTDFNTRDLSE